ncbi:MAG: hypothetical protein EXR66_03655 [Dehalococcoidia bacterium]|nr:hypothetical protein [Dehalococcoidia bacterium]
MSKLRERIRESGQRRVRSFGFVRRDDGPPIPQLLVMAEVADATAGAAAIEAGGRALLFTGDRSALKDLVTAAKGTPVGMRIDAATREDTKALLEAGADFLVFDAAQTVAEALLERKLGRVVVAPASAADDDLKRYGALDLDAILVGDPGSLLSVHGQLEMRRLAEFTRAPLAVLVSGAIPATTLEVWRNGGASVVLVPAASGALADIIEATNAVPPPEPENLERGIALAPQQRSQDHDEDDDMDDRLR